MEHIDKNYHRDILMSLITRMTHLEMKIDRLTIMEKKMDEILTRFDQLEIVEFEDELSTVSEESDSKDENLTNNNDLTSKAEARQDDSGTLLPSWKQEILLHSGGLSQPETSQNQSNSSSEGSRL